MRNREGLKFLFHCTVCFQFNPLSSNIRLFARFLLQIIQFNYFWVLSVDYRHPFCSRFSIAYLLPAINNKREGEAWKHV